MIALHMQAPGYALPGRAHTFFGSTIVVLGLAATIWGSRRFRVAQTNIVTFERPQVLVEDGLFRWTRNPMYVGFSLALFGFWLGLGSLTPGFLPFLFVGIADRWYIPFEECLMRETFGSEYTRYCQRTRRWV